MKSKIFTVALLSTAVLLSACGPSTVPVPAGMTQVCGADPQNQSKQRCVFVPIGQMQQYANNYGPQYNAAGQPVYSGQPGYQQPPATQVAPQSSGVGTGTAVAAAAAAGVGGYLLGKNSANNAAPTQSVPTPTAAPVYRAPNNVVAQPAPAPSQTSSFTPQAAKNATTVTAPTVNTPKVASTAPSFAPKAAYSAPVTTYKPPVTSSFKPSSAMKSTTSSFKPTSAAKRK